MTERSSSWRLVRFGDVVRNVNASVRDPLTAGLDRYVGLDHLDPDSLHIKRWGLVADGTTFTRKFAKGQVLFGKRRAYQRKAALADFDGICSGDILVVEPATNELLPDLLPFIVQTDGFFERAIGTSAGSLSPRTKWKDLAAYEFALPPLKEQRRIAEVLLAAEEAKEDFENCILQMDAFKKATLTRLTTTGICKGALRSTETRDLPAYWEIKPVGDLLKVCQYGLSQAAVAAGRIPMFRMMNLKAGVVVADDMVTVDLSPAEFAVYRLEKGDILFNRTNSPDLVGKVGIFRLDGSYVFASYLIRLRAQEDIVLPEYLNYYLNSEAGQRRIVSFATKGVSQSNINATNLKRVLVPVPPIEEQKEMISILSMIDSDKEQLCNHLVVLRSVKEELLSRLLSKN